MDNPGSSGPSHKQSDSSLFGSGDDYYAEPIENYLTKEYLLMNDFKEDEDCRFHKTDEQGFTVTLSQQNDWWLFEYECERGSVNWDLKLVRELKTLLDNCGIDSSCFLTD